MCASKHNPVMLLCIPVVLKINSVSYCLPKKAKLSLGTLSHCCGSSQPQIQDCWYLDQKAASCKQG